MNRRSFLVLAGNAAAAMVFRLPICPPVLTAEAGGLFVPVELAWQMVEKRMRLSYISISRLPTQIGML